MTIEERVGRTLEALGVADAQGVESLFGEVRKSAEVELAELVSRGAPDETERDHLCKSLRDRWLARKGGVLSQVDENWFKPAAKELKPTVGRHFNELRRFTAGLEFDKLVQTVPLRQQPQKQMELPLASEAVRPVRRDLTLPGVRRALGSIHPVTLMQREIEDIFLRLGFAHRERSGD